MLSGPPGGPAGDAITLRRGEGGAFLVEDAGGARCYEGHDAAEALEILVRSANQSVLSSAQADLLLVHGGAVQRGKSTVILPAASEAGKSTLTAGLVAAGWAYGTDDIVAIDPTTSLVHPYPRPICLDPGSHYLFAKHQPEIDPEWQSMLSRQWHLTVDELAPDGPGVAQPRLATHIVFPRYEAGAETQLTPLTRPQALLDLLQLRLRDAESERSTFEILAPIVASSSCHRLVVGRLDAAVSELEAVVDASSEPLGRAQLLDLSTAESARPDLHLLADLPGPTADDIFGRCAETQTIDLDGALLIHHRGSGVTHELNAVAAQVWMVLDGTRTLADVAADLSDQYGRDVQDDVITLVHSLATDGFIRSIAGARA